MDGRVSNAHPHEVGGPDLACAQWRKSSYSNGQANCVEIATNLPGLVAVRDSKDPDGPSLAIGLDTWQAFVRSIRASL